ncbi:uncharacterized protein ACLA_012820 [Aspergillus clavatus NRRL 1]|uniref:5'-3' DNA helicase ZGRF1-like N-terminal domain-containing protein n=1 Tax=Aspergillus clavatus (strain ATCC 1007 / CBS 513.65 / DSM 816 / NCTC 3887 / NRRL 1 / QM 1276 / 107) TaxID=344612 RepID=A1CAT6_ASPCL|nr:uncharacterized protein ACLA_012820 [Aspergillus clavatus NRRL 1]EAW12854.1 conserved hypothetical protein [Aspergillus clavatus NRRL 1]
MSTPLSSAATPRGTASLNVPATQNTAPVVKFRCLFTHDVRRKAKRWHDGFLRYHTFNKRVMCYDNTGYFIGDLHWRQDEGIQDGDELELDKGVLIQVCEPVEKTETDLSTLYSNKKKTQDSPPQAGRSPAPLLRSSASSRPSIPSQSQQPRSLNEVLGIRKMPIGPPQSPFEEREQQRQKEDNQLVSERAAKRQRTAASERQTDQRPSDVVPNVPVLVDLSESSSERPERTNKVTPAAQSVSTLASKNPTPTSRPDPPATKNTSSSDVPRAAEPHQAPSNAPAPASRSISAQSPSDTPRSTLRLSTSQPRKKLMYQALLPNPPAEKTAPQDKKIRPVQSRSQLVCALWQFWNLTDSPSEAKPLSMQDLSSTNMDFIPTESTMGVLQGMLMDIVPESPLRMNGARGTMMNQLLRPTTTLETRTSAPLPSKPPSKGLRKALSDPTALAASNTVQSRSLLMKRSLFAEPIEEHPLEQGPWTSEALDLFDFWPPGRPKPA